MEPTRQRQGGGPQETHPLKERQAITLPDRKRECQMRNHRLATALVLPGALAASVVFLTATSGDPVTDKGRHHVWHHPLAPQPTMLLTTANLKPIADYEDAVLAAQERAAVSAFASAEAKQVALTPLAPSIGATSPTTTTTQPPATSTGDYDHRWDAVARCENGGWNPPQGSAYPDSLGINATNWAAYNGGSDLSPANQIRVAQEIEAAAGTPNYVPDQGYCASW